jgi:hypothetical protein
MPGKFILTDSEREVFLKKVLPTMFIGSLIWLISELIFGYYFTTIAYPPDLLLIIYIAMNILNVILFLMFFLLSRKKHHELAILAYFTFAFSAGIIFVPISMIDILGYSLSTYVHAFVSLAVGGTAVVLLLGLILKERFLAEGYFEYHFLFTLGGSFIVLLVFLLVFRVTNIYLITASIIILIIVALLVLLYGATSTKKVKEEYWVFITFRILGYLLIFSFVLIITIIIIIVLIVLSEGDFDFGGFGGGGGSGSTKKKKKSPSIVMK